MGTTRELLNRGNVVNRNDAVKLQAVESDKGKHWADEGREPEVGGRERAKMRITTMMPFSCIRLGIK